MTSELPAPLPPEAIEPRSFAIIDAEAPHPRPFSGPAWSIVRRLIHTTGDFQIMDSVRLHPGALEAGVAALRYGCNIVTDTEMARMGMPERRLKPLGCRAICLLNEPETTRIAAERGLTRTAAAVDAAVEGASPLLKHGLEGCIVAIGNAPTALLRLLERLEQGAAAPALIVGMPVGFVLAAESKQCLMEREPAPYVCIAGRKGGSPLAAATVNALAELALQEPGP